ncbi:hypothetical protein FKW77_006636 [Venturia effusa]|uniref:Uncharacterized protein n=1 Tax=Venturia effusa TaxID=50376 RepID=A0A517LFX5_9PEZI|nr:hypothetical protein FKW77_006636 [Venturia effusa]
MVLEGASRPPTDPYDYGSLASDTPYSDMDPYDSSGSSPSSIDFNALYRPMPIMSYLTGQSPPMFQNMIVRGVEQTSQRLHRQLSPEETQALAMAYSKAYSYGSWANGLGFFAGWARCYSTADTFKWPWGKDKVVKNPNILGPLRGAAARMGWHVLRSIPYGIAGYLVLGSFGSAYGGTVFMVTRARDPALKLLDKQLTDLIKQQQGQIATPNKPTSNYGAVKEEADVPYDDMSPQAGNDGALLSDSQMRIEESRQQNDALRPKPVTDRITMSEEKNDWVEEWTAKASDNDSRAGKPVNDPKYGMSTAEKQAGSGTTNESTWERLRREAVERANK